MNMYLKMYLVGLVLYVGINLCYILIGGYTKWSGGGEFKDLFSFAEELPADKVNKGKAILWAVILGLFVIAMIAWPMSVIADIVLRIKRHKERKAMNAVKF